MNRSIMIVLFALSICSCNQESATENSDVSTAVEHQALSVNSLPASSGETPRSFEFRSSKSGTFSLELKGKRAELRDGTGKSLATYTVESGKTKIDGHGVVKGGAEKVKLLNEQDELRLYLRQYEDGDFKLKNAAGSLVVKAKKQDYGFKVVNDSGQVLFKVKQKNGHPVLQNEQGERLMEVSATASNLAALPLGIEELSIEERVGFFLQIHSWGAM